MGKMAAAMAAVAVLMLAGCKPPEPQYSPVTVKVVSVTKTFGWVGATRYTTLVEVVGTGKRTTWGGKWGEEGDTFEAKAWDDGIVRP
jgi:hypothetical protein